MIFIKFWAFSPFLILFLIVLIQEVMVIYTYLNPSQTEGIFLVVHHLLLFLIIYTFCLVMKTDAGRPCRPSQSQNEENHKLVNLKICKYCQIEKPTRCHHCRQCNRCVLRMDHHCPWVNNCIGQNNYKAFFCLITYSTILSVLYSICYMIKVLSIIEFGHIEIYFIIFNCTLSFAVSILLLLFLGFHLRLISNNQTTLEYFEKNTNYDKGMCNNFQEFLGPSFWLFP